MQHLKEYGRGRCQSRFIVLLDMRKCQSDYNEGPQCVYRFVTCFAAPFPLPAAMIGRQIPPCQLFIHSLTRCLHAHRARRRQDPVGGTPQLSSRGPQHCALVGAKVLAYAGALIDARLSFVWGQAENLRHPDQSQRTLPKLICPFAKLAKGNVLIFSGPQKSSLAQVLAGSVTVVRKHRPLGPGSPRPYSSVICMFHGVLRR